MADGPEVVELDRTAQETFVEWVSEAMLEAAGEGALLVEMRFGAGWVMWPDLMSRFREAERLAQAEHPGFCAEAVISGVWAGRGDGNDVIDACLDARSAGLAGIDFVPMPYEREAETAHWKEVYSWAERAASAGLGITVHAGEFSPVNLSRAIETPGVTRIGHAVLAAFDNALLGKLAKAQITVECCLTSNMVLGAVPSLEDHPIRTFVDAAIPVTLCSDDPVRLCTSIGSEYQLAASLGFGASELVRFTRSGIAASFASPERRGIPAMRGNAACGGEA